MAVISRDRVRDTSTTTGTGPFAVSGTAPTANQTFSAVCAVGDVFNGVIASQSANEWVSGLLTYSAANQITVTQVYESSNAGSAVTFTAGIKDVWIDLPASRFAALNGASVAQSNMRAWL